MAQRKLKKNTEAVSKENNDCDISVKKDFGINNKEVLEEVIVKAALAMPGDIKSIVQILGNSTLEMKPQDPVEAKLCAKESTLYSLAMTYLHRAETNRNAEHMSERLWFESDMNFALRLLKAHNETVEIMHKYKRGAEQKIIVQHVQVNRGGQAVVGNIETGGNA